MNIFLLGLSFLLTTNVVNTAPAENLFIPSIKQICPGDIENLFLELKSLNECQDKAILNETKLTRENEKRFRCLLFQESILSFCKEIAKLHLELPKLETHTIHTYTTEQVCKDLFPTDRTFEHDLSKIILPEKCEKFCTDYDDTKEPVVECSMAYYFAHFNMSSLRSPSNQSNSKVGQASNDQGANPQDQSENQPQSIAIKPVVENTPETNVSKPLNDITLPNSSNQNPAGVNPDKIELEDLNAKKKTEDAHSNKPNETSQNSPSPQSTFDNTENVPKHVIAAQLEPEVSNVQTDKEEKGSNGNHPEPETMQQESEQSPQTNHKDVPKNPQTSTTVLDIKPVNTAEVAPEQVAEQEPNNREVEAGVNDENNAERGEDTGVKPGLEDNDFEEQEDDDLEDVQDLHEAPIVDQKPKETRKSNTLESAVNEDNIEELDGDSYFFSYFMVICVLFVLGYVGYHNRIKVMALMLEGKRNKRQYRGRRPNSANYHKLDSNLEEAISSTCTKNANNVIY